METKQPEQREFLAIFYISGGSSWARGFDVDDVVKQCAKIAVNDWSSLFNIENTEAPINVFDITGHSNVHWTPHGVEGDGPNKIEYIETRTVTLPKRRRR